MDFSRTILIPVFTKDGLDTTRFETVQVSFSGLDAALQELAALSGGYWKKGRS